MSKEAITREISVNGGGVDDLSQLETPYTDAIRRYADIDYVRLDVPGHSGSAVAQPELAELFGERLLELDLPPLVDGIDQGPAPTALQQSARLAAQARGAPAAPGW